MVIQTIIFMTLVMVLDNLKFTLFDRQQIQEGEKHFKKSEDLLKEKEKISKVT